MIKIKIIKQSKGTVEGFIRNFFAHCRSRAGLSTLFNTALVSNNYQLPTTRASTESQVAENGNVTFTDRDARKLRLLSNDSVRDIAGSGVN